MLGFLGDFGDFGAVPEMGDWEDMFVGVWEVEMGGRWMDGDLSGEGLVGGF